MCGRKNAFVNQPLAKVDTMTEIDLQGDDSGPTDRRLAYQHRPIPTVFQRAFHASLVYLPRTIVLAALE